MIGVSSVENTPIFDELLRRSGMSLADPMVEPAVERNPPAESSSPPKIIVAGGAGVGKTTFVGSVSKIAPLDVEAWMTEAGKATTTVAMDFGRIALHPDLVLYLFGTAEQPPSWLAGALGAVVLVDTRRVEESFAAVEHVGCHDERDVGVVLEVVDGRLAHDLDRVREALALAPEVPLTTCDARDPGSTAKALQELVSYAKNRTVSHPER